MMKILKPRASSPGLYLHIPFCRRKCDYCSFFSVLPSEEVVDRFVSSAKKEMELSRHLVRSNPIETVYVGGGTPGVLGEKLFKILGYLYENFDLDGAKEFTVELNPESGPEWLLKGLKGFRVNRLSIGIQSFNDSLLRVLGRIHDSETAKKAYTQARDAGFENISLDLMGGIPGQSMELLQDDLEEAVSLSPEHISFYLLTVEEATELRELVNSGKISLPSETTQRKTILYVSRFLAEMGYERYETSNLAKPGFESKHNLNYWKRGEYLGLGPSACSHLEGRRWRNSDNLEGYINSLENAMFPRADEEILTERDILLETFLLGLRTAEGVAVQTLKEILPEEKRHHLMSSIAFLSKQGFICKRNSAIFVTEKGLPVSDSIILELASLI